MSEHNRWEDEGGFVPEDDDGLDADELSEQYHEEQDELNDSDLFTERYGFVHDCHCADDWDTGNVGLVSVCYLGMVEDAMNTLASKVRVERELQAEIAQLRIALVEAEQASASK